MLYIDVRFMRTKYDQLVKAIFGALLRPVVAADTAREIPGQVQIADLWVEPDPARADEFARLGALGRMLESGPCLIEPFSRAPRIDEIRGCILEQYTLDHHQVREASAADRSRPAFPVLWVIAAGRPDTVIEAMALGEMEGWPAGFWQRRPFDAFHLVVARELPETPETLFLRLLARGPTFRKALDELFSGKNWARAVLEPVLVAFRREMPQDLGEDEEDMEALRHFEAVYADWERRVKDEARKEGRKAGRKAGRKEGRKKGLEKGRDEGLRQGERLGLLESIEMLCNAFELELSDDRRAQLEASDTDQLKSLFVTISTTRDWPAS